MDGDNSYRKGWGFVISYVEEETEQIDLSGRLRPGDLREIEKSTAKIESECEGRRAP